MAPDERWLSAPRPGQRGIESVGDGCRYGPAGARIPALEETPGLSAERSLADLMAAPGVQAWPLAGLLAAGHTASTLGGPVAQQGLPGHGLKARRS